MTKQATGQGRQAPLALDHFQKDIHGPMVLDEFEYGDSALSNMCIMHHLMSRSIWAFFKLEYKSIAKYINQHKFRFFHNRDFLRMFYAFPASHIKNHR